MCVIIGCINRKPNLSILKRCEAANSDGAGVAWINSKTKMANYKKGLNAQQVFDLIQDLPLPFIVHFRWASIGGKHELLTHPFEMTVESPLRLEGESKKLLIHNGTVGDYEIYLAAAKLKKPLNEPFSDTRAVAMVAGNDNEDFLKVIKGNYIVIDGDLDKFRTYGEFKEGFEEEEKGMVFSNFTWRYRNVNTNTNSHRSVTTYENHHHFSGHNSNNQEKQENTTSSNVSYTEEELDAWWRERTVQE